jgi:Uma2 family endonuclease
MATVIATDAGRVLMDGVTWETYQCLLRESEGGAGSRLAYDRGKLEITSPLFAHEEDKRNLEIVVQIVTLEWGVRCRPAGSLTLKREDLARGVEPDSGFYIQSYPAIRGKREINLEGGDPPPDLAVEVDLTSPSLDKLPLYAAMGVPEIWRLRGDGLTILVLRDGAYHESDASLALPLLTRAVLAEFVRKSRGDDPLDWQRAVRAWARGVSGNAGS